MATVVPSGRGENLIGRVVLQGLENEQKEKDRRLREKELALEERKVVLEERSAPGNEAYKGALTASTLAGIRTSAERAADNEYKEAERRLRVAQTTQIGASLSEAQAELELSKKRVEMLGKMTDDELKTALFSGYSANKANEAYNLAQSMNMLLSAQLKQQEVAQNQAERKQKVFGSQFGWIDDVGKDLAPADRSILGGLRQNLFDSMKEDGSVDPNVKGETFNFLNEAAKRKNQFDIAETRLKSQAGTEGSVSASTAVSFWKRDPKGELVNADKLGPATRKRADALLRAGIIPTVLPINVWSLASPISSAMGSNLVYMDKQEAKDRGMEDKWNAAYQDTFGVGAGPSGVNELDSLIDITAGSMGAQR